MQGQNNWYYYKSTQAGSYVQMERYSSGEWSSESWMKISATLMHPQNGFDAVRGYRVAHTGILTMTGRLRKTSEGFGGNGVMAYIYVNNSLVWSSFLGATDAEGIFYNISVNVTEGDFVYLHLNANGNDSYDETEWIQINAYSAIADEIKSTAARRIDEKIADLSVGSLTLADRKTVEALWDSYLRLDENDKRSVSGYVRLLSAKIEIDSLSGDAEAALATDNAIRLAVTSESKNLLYIARSLYDSLSLPQKGLVTMLDELEKAEAKTLQSQIALLTARIASFDAEAITSLDRKAIEALRSEADLLKESGLSLPTETENALQALEEALSQAVAIG